MLIIKTHIKGHTLLRQDGEGQKQGAKGKQNNQILISAMKNGQSCIPDNKGKMGNYFNKRRSC